MSAAVKETPNGKPIGQIKALLKNTIYCYSNGEYHRTSKYMDIGEVAYLYSVNGSYGSIGDGLFVRDLDNTHFELSYGLLTVIGENVHTCSRNGVEKRKLDKGKTFKVIDIIQTGKDTALFKINKTEYLSNKQAVTLKSFAN